jgi:hypothetical protein
MPPTHKLWVSGGAGLYFGFLKHVFILRCRNEIYVLSSTYFYSQLDTHAAVEETIMSFDSFDMAKMAQ